MTTWLKLSSKRDALGKSEILVLYMCFGVNIRVKSNIFVSPCLFAWAVDKRNSTDAKKDFVTEEENEKFGYTLLTRGCITKVNRNKFDADKLNKESAEVSEKINSLCSMIEQEASATDLKSMVAEERSAWIKGIVKRFHNTDEASEEIAKPKFFDLVPIYLHDNVRNVSEGYRRAAFVVFRAFWRFEQFRQKVLSENFVADYDTLTAQDITEFRSFLKNEPTLFKENPTFYTRLIYPSSLMDGVKEKGCNNITARSENTIIGNVKKLKTFMLWLSEKKYTTNRVFEQIKVGSPKYCAPVFLTDEELSIIESANLSSKALEVQRDIFILQCQLACRVSDFYRLTESNIDGDFITYVPNKTAKEGAFARPAIRPLNKKIRGLIEKYRGVDRQGRLMPFISTDKYCKSIKKILEQSGITRMVQRFDKDGNIEQVRLCDIAASHLARRTFIGNAVNAHIDPLFIRRVSGHSDNSAAFARYFDVMENSLKDIFGDKND